MMNSTEFAKKVNRSRATVLNWCAKGLLPGAEKVKIPGGYAYVIPDDAQIPIPARAKQKKTNPLTSIKKTPKNYGNSEHGLQLAFVAQNCANMSIRRIAKQLGTTADDVRRLYDEVLEMEVTALEYAEVV